MKTKMFTSFIFYFTLLATFIKASDILFTASSSSIKPSVTTNWTLKCSLQDSNLTTSNGVIGRRQLTHTDDDDMIITSLLIVHNGRDIASVSDHSPVHLMKNTPNMSVSGAISHDHANRERGFIEVSLPQPTSSDTGEYQCAVTGLSKDGRHFVFSKTLEIVEENITVSDLMAEIALLKKMINDMKAEKSTMQGQMSTMTGDISTITGQITSLSGQVSTMNGQISSLSQEENSVKTRLTAVETKASAARGVVYTSCSWSGWVNDWDQEFSYTAPGHNNVVIIGVHSKHYNPAEDRKFMFQYCQLTSPAP